MNPIVESKQALRAWRHVVVLGTALALIPSLPGCPGRTPSDSDADSSVCGNGEVEGDEECDDGDANSDSSPNACRSTCRLAHCGDGVMDDGEICDRTSLPGGGCVAEGFVGGSLSCTDVCQLDTTLCTNCGNGQINQEEDCGA